ncbi:hypothetical protein [Moorena producens]|uniref:hypothetical protein n=1 Tax=Moorena producens TaxID=1155739 RepID=UPI003C706B42
MVSGQWSAVSGQRSAVSLCAMDMLRVTLSQRRSLCDENIDNGHLSGMGILPVSIPGPAESPLYYYSFFSRFPTPDSRLPTPDSPKSQNPAKIKPCRAS